MIKLWGVVVSKLIVTVCLIFGFMSSGWAGSGTVLQPKAAQAATDARIQATQSVNSKVNNNASVKKATNTAKTVCGQGKQLVGYNGSNTPICVTKNHK